VIDDEAIVESLLLLRVFFLVNPPAVTGLSSETVLDSSAIYTDFLMPLDLRVFFFCKPVLSFASDLVTLGEALSFCGPF